MKNFYFECIASSVTLKWKCPKCGKEQEYTFVPPTPDYESETIAGSCNSDSEEVECDNCGHIINIDYYNSFGEGGGQIDVDDENFISCDDECDDDFDMNYNYRLEPYQKDLEYIKESLSAIHKINNDLQPFWYRLLYANLISTMETYLSDTLKGFIFSSDECFRKFVETFKPYSEKSLKLSEIYKYNETLKTRVKKDLDELLYHNLPKINPIYKATLGIDLGDFEELKKAVKIRHDLIHRCGQDTDGNIHIIEEQAVLDLYDLVSQFIGNINNQIVDQLFETNDSNVKSEIEEVTELNKGELPF